MKKGIKNRIKPFDVYKMIAIMFLLFGFITFLCFSYVYAISFRTGISFKDIILVFLFGTLPLILHISLMSVSFKFIKEFITLSKKEKFFTYLYSYISEIVGFILSFLIINFIFQK